MTLFLVYLLLQLLGQKQVVAVQYEARLYALFHNRDQVTFHSVGDSAPLDDCGTTWALADSNSNVRDPHPIFVNSDIRTIQATSPRRDRWHEWSKQARARCYTMDFWSEQEVVELA